MMPRMDTAPPARSLWHRRWHGVPLRLLLMLLAALAAAALFMTAGSTGDWSFLLMFRGTKLAVMVLVACAIAVSTVLFQTITHNRILTPALIGFDALYALIQAAAAYGLGSELAQLGEASVGQFLVQVVVMAGLACALFFWLFTDSTQSLHRMILVGIIFGLLFRSLTNLIMRMIDPNEFLVLQDRLFASFNYAEGSLLIVAAVLLGACALVTWRLLPRYDVIALGRPMAVGLGVQYHRTVLLTLVLIAVMVSVSTALVGPITFLGLLVSNLAYFLLGTDRHRYTLPAAILIAITLLVGGQAVLEHVLKLGTSVSVVIEFVGGLLFLVLITAKAKR